MRERENAGAIGGERIVSGSRNPSPRRAGTNATTAGAAPAVGTEAQSAQNACVSAEASLRSPPSM